MCEPESSKWEKILDQGLADGKTILTVLEGFTDGIFGIEPLKGAVKVAKEVIGIIQVSHASIRIDHWREATNCHLQEARTNRAESTELARQIGVLTLMIDSVLKDRADEDVTKELQEDLERVARYVAVST